MTTPTSVNDADVFADGPSPLNVVVVVVRSVVACTCTRFSISVYIRHAVTDVVYSATELNTIRTFCRTAS